MAREGFVLYHEILEWLEPYGDAERGRLLTSMLTYSLTGAAPGLSGNERFLWPAIKAKIDADRRAYEATCEKNRKNVSKRYDGIPEDTTAYDRIPPNTTVCDRIPPNTTAYEALPKLPTETETRTETKQKQKSPSESVSHAHGEYGWVKLTDDQYAKLQQELGQEELDRCIRYVDESAQSTGNKNRWKDWNLTIRKCHRDGWGLTQAKPKKYTTADSYRPPQPTAKTVTELAALVDRI